MRVTACSNRMNSSHFSVRDGPLEKLWGWGEGIFEPQEFFFVVKFLVWIFFTPSHEYLPGLIGVQEFSSFNFPLREYFFLSRFLYISLSSLLHGYNVKVPYFTFCRRREHKTTTFLIFSWTLIQSFRIQLRKNLPKFDELNEME